jgi:hypothetical protein
MASKKPHELVKGDDIVLWVGPAVGEVNALVDSVEKLQGSLNQYVLKVQEIEWAVLIVHGDKDIDLADW